MSRGLYLGLHSFLFVKCDTSSSIISHTFANVVYFGSFLFARYALSSQSAVHSGRTRTEIFRETVDCLHLYL